MVVIDLFFDSRLDAQKAMKIRRVAVATSRFVCLSRGHQVDILLKDFPFCRLARAKAFVRDLRNEFDVLDIFGRRNRGFNISAHRGDLRDRARGRCRYAFLCVAKLLLINTSYKLEKAIIAAGTTVLE